MKRVESLISRGHLRGYSEPSTTMPLYVDQDKLLGRRVPGDNFEFMTSSQLRDELRREKVRRRETEVELDSIKYNGVGFSSPAGVYVSPASRQLDPLHTSMDSDSGISYSFSNRTKSPAGHSPLLLMSAGDISPQSVARTDGLSLKHIKDAMYESEKRRLTLMDKLREAHETLQMQTDRLCESETMLTDKQNTVQSLVSTNESLQQKFMKLQRNCDVNEAGKIEADKKRELMQRRVEDLDQKLKNLQVSHNAMQSEHRQREIILEQTTLSLKLMEEENMQFQQTKDTMLKEALALRESLQMSRTKCEKLKMDLQEHDSMRENCKLLTSKNTDLSSELSENQNLVSELGNQLHLIEGNNKRLIQERDSFQRHAIDLEETSAELSSKLMTACGAKERLVQEKIDLQQILKYAGHETQQNLLANRELVERLEEYKNVCFKTNTDLRGIQEEQVVLEQEIAALKKVGQDLSTELASVKKNLEASQEEERQLQSQKKSAQQQSAYWENEVKRLTGERDSNSKSVDRLRSELDRERDLNSEQIHQLRENCRSIRQEKDDLQIRCQELEAKHQRANSDLHQATLIHQQELEDWKSSCEQLTNNISEKNREMVMLAERIEESNDKLTELNGENSAYRIRQERFDDYEREVERLQEKLHELTHQHAEDQQVISLLEMQKNILTKNQSSSCNKLTSDHMRAEVERLKAELQLSQDKMFELKAELDRAHIADHLRFIPPCNKCEEFQESNARLREINKMMTDRVSKVENEAELSGKQASVAQHLKVKCQNLEDQIQTLQDLNLKLSRQVAKLEKDNIRMSGRAMKVEEFGERNHDLDEQNQTLQELNQILSNKVTRIEQEHQSAVHTRERELFDQNQTLADINQMLTDKVSKLEQEKKNILMKQPKGDMVSLKEYERVGREKERITSEMEIMKHENADLQDRHKTFVTDHLSRTLEKAPPMSPESKDPSQEADENSSRQNDVYEVGMRKLKQENEALRRQNDLSRSQTVIADNARKRAEDRIHQTELNLADLTKTLETSSTDKVDSQAQVQQLKNELSDSVKDIASLGRSVSSLQASNQQLEDNKVMLQRENRKLNTQGSGACPDCSSLRTDVQNLTQEKEVLEEENEGLKQDVEQLESQLDLMQQDVDTSQVNQADSSSSQVSSSEKTTSKVPTLVLTEPRRTSLNVKGSLRQFPSEHRLSLRDIRASKHDASPRRLSMRDLDSLREEGSFRSMGRRQSQMKELLLPSSQKFNRDEPSSSGRQVVENLTSSSRSVAGGKEVQDTLEARKSKIPVMSLNEVPLPINYANTKMTDNI